MQEGIAFETDIYEASIESGHELSDLSQIDVAHREMFGSSFALIFDKSLVFQQCDGYVFGRHIYNYFACHVLLLLCM